MPTLSRQSCWVQHRVQTTRSLGEGPGPRTPCDIVSDWRRLGQEADLQGRPLRPRILILIHPSPGPRSVRLADVTSAFRAHRKTMTPWIVPAPPRTPPNGGIAAVVSPLSGLCTTCQQLCIKGVPFRICGTPRGYIGGNALAPTRRELLATEASESLCFQGASP